ncbi:hypothetical protein HGM15179_018442 [Zosterops borbonicus]|uniref:C2H2-type domain-containing protein n=1 Tax=Zosterops borbonicus TaxID=364589 RepID=A0A8K1FZ07_9PASS|nr:hypothetical protein HGM15179_018442 [Zosterops borbonicus]
MKCHPDVFPKKQHASKLGGYFTAVYADEHEKSTPAEERNNFEKFEVESKAQETEWFPFRCIKCFKLSFGIAELLCMHYTAHHSKDLKRDFTLLGSGTCSHNAVYHCKHCDTKLHSMAELTSHLNSHNEEFQKCAKRQERSKQLLSKQKYADGAFTDFKQEREAEDSSRTTLEGFEGAKDPVEFTEAESGASLEDETRPGGYHCSQCDWVLMSMQGLLSHEKGHLALAMFTQEDKYSCQYCSFVSAFRHNSFNMVTQLFNQHTPPVGKETVFLCLILSEKPQTFLVAPDIEWNGMEWNRIFHLEGTYDSSMVIKSKVLVEAPVLEPDIDVLGMPVSSIDFPHYWENQGKHNLFS